MNEAYRYVRSGANAGLVEMLSYPMVDWRSHGIEVGFLQEETMAQLHAMWLLTGP